MRITQIQLPNAVRSGAHFAALSGYPSNNVIQTEVQSVAASLPITVTSSYSPSPCSACLGIQLPTLTVNGAYTYTGITPVGALPQFFGGTIGSTVALTSSSTLNNEC